jgi:hypothetical protein
MSDRHQLLAVVHGHSPNWNFGHWLSSKTNKPTTSASVFNWHGEKEKQTLGGQVIGEIPGHSDTWGKNGQNITRSQTKKKSPNRHGVAQSVPEGLVSQISTTFGTWRWWVCQPHAPAAFTPRKCFWYSFSLGAESTQGSWHGRKEYVTEKASETTENRSRGPSAVP